MQNKQGDVKNIFFKFLFIDFREKAREEVGERETDLLFYLFIHSLLDSCMCPDQGLKPQPWHSGMML